VTYAGFRAAVPVTRLAYLGDPQPTPNGEAPRKGGVNIGCHKTNLDGTPRSSGTPTYSGANKHNYKKSMTLASWNVRTLTDLQQSDRPERRTALVSRELARFDVDIAALSETRLPENGCIEEVGSGYTFYWQGRAETEARTHGVGFAIKTSIAKRHHLEPNCINERLMTLRLPLSSGNHLTVVSAYAPTLTSPDDLKEVFYSELHRVTRTIPDQDKLLVIGDFNARVGGEYGVWGGILGKHGIGRCNANGHLLLNYCAEHELFITGTCFQLPTRHKTTWQHPRSKHWHQLDHVLARQRDRGDVLLTRSMPGADDCWTDHRLVVSRVRLNLRRVTRSNTSGCSVRRFDCGRIRLPAVMNEYRAHLEEKLDRHRETEYMNVEDEWQSLRETVTSAAESILGFSTVKHKDWFDEQDEEIAQLIEQKRRARLLYEHRPTQEHKHQFSNARRICQSRIRELQNSWWQKKSEELQRQADRNDMRGFFEGTKELYGPLKCHSSSLLDATGEALVSNPTDILQRWREHFEVLLNDHAQTEDDLLHKVPLHNQRDWMSVAPNMNELLGALKRMKPRKSPGPDNIPIELFTAGGDEAAEALLHLIQRIWNTGRVPSDFRDANIVTIFKKGDRSVCGNYRGISLLSTAGKCFARILLDRLLVVAEEVLPESQCGFRQSRGTVDMVFCARQLQEKAREQRRPLLYIFWDLKKAFDKVPRPAMWATLSRFGCPPLFVALVRELHEGMKARVSVAGTLSDAFSVTGGLRQGCVLAPTLFSLYLAAMLYELPADTPGIDMRYRLDGGLFNQARLKAHTKTSMQRITELQYADDNATPASSPEDLQLLADIFSSAYQRFGMEVNTDKTKVLIQPAPGYPLQEVDVVLGGRSLESVSSFPYLGSLLSRSATCSEDVNNRIRAAHHAYGKLSKRVFNDHNLTTKTKIMVYRSVVVPTLLYASETWTLYRDDVRRLERFHQAKLRSILRVSWQDRVTNCEVLSRASLTSIEAIILKNRLRWIGHVSRMPPTRLPRTIMYGELAEGTRPLGRPKYRYKDQAKASFRSIGLDHTTWEEEASERGQWRGAVSRGVDEFEEDRVRTECRKRVARHERRIRADQPEPTLPCDYCNRLFQTHLGLSSHVRHRHRGQHAGRAGGI